MQQCPNLNLFGHCSPPPHDRKQFCAGMQRHGTLRLDPIFMLKICESAIYFLHFFCRHVLYIGGQMRNLVGMVQTGLFPVCAFDIPFRHFSPQAKEPGIPDFIGRIVPRLSERIRIALAVMIVLRAAVMRLTGFFFRMPGAVIEPARPVEMLDDVPAESAIGARIILVLMLDRPAVARPAEIFDCIRIASALCADPFVNSMSVHHCSPVFVDEQRIRVRRRRTALNRVARRFKTERLPSTPPCARSRSWEIQCMCIGQHTVIV